MSRRSSNDVTTEAGAAASSAALARLGAPLDLQRYDVDDETRRRSPRGRASLRRRQGVATPLGQPAARRRKRGASAFSAGPARRRCLWTAEIEMEMM